MTKVRKINMENFDMDGLLTGFVIVAKAIDRANALKAIEMRYNHDLTMDEQHFMGMMLELVIEREMEVSDDE